MSDRLVNLSRHLHRFLRKKARNKRSSEVKILEVPLLFVRSCVDVSAQLTSLFDVGVCEVGEGEASDAGRGDGEARVVGGTVPALLQGAVRRGWRQILRGCRGPTGPTGRMITGCF